MTLYVFLGPSLPLPSARALLDAVYLPPAACGDIEALVARRPTAIGLIDGYFEHKPSVFHKEILHALSSGIRVLGASSMGALRAAELHQFGMEGVGYVFDAYRRGQLEADDEVAVIHGPAETGYLPFSDALVCLREGLGRARDRGVISATAHDELVRRARAPFYGERSWRRLLADVRARPDGLEDVNPEVLEHFLRREDPNIKRDDAVELLTRMAKIGAPGDIPPAPPHFPATLFWHRLATKVEHAAGYGELPSSDIPASAYTMHARIFSDPHRTLAREALALTLISEVSELRGLTATDAEIDAAQSASAMTLADVPAQTARALAKLDVLAAKLLTETDATKLSAHVPLALARRGQLGSTIAAVRAQWRRLKERGQWRPTLRGAGLGVADLLHWLRARIGATETSLEALAHALGLDPDHLLEEALRKYLDERLPNSAVPALSPPEHSP